MKFQHPWVVVHIRRLVKWVWRHRQVLPTIQLQASQQSQHRSCAGTAAWFVRLVLEELLGAVKNVAIAIRFCRCTLQEPTEPTPAEVSQEKLSRFLTRLSGNYVKCSTRCGSWFNKKLTGTIVKHFGSHGHPLHKRTKILSPRVGPLIVLYILLGFFFCVCVISVRAFESWIRRVLRHDAKRLGLHLRSDGSVTLQVGTRWISPS